MMILAAFLALAQAASAPCTFDRAALLAMDEQAFDQDLEGGWRPLEQRDCKAEVADLLRDYRAAHPDGRLNAVIGWHEGQVRAKLGQTERAIALFDAARKPPEQDSIGWNHYVAGSIAFLRHDRAALQQARDMLAALPRPNQLPTWTVNGKKVPMAWPVNLNVLDGFLRCFDKPYEQAYGQECSVPFKVKVE